jgi:hypothetical protein
MAEKSVPITDGVPGSRIAVRDAFDLDDGLNARLIERVDFASGKYPSPIGFPVRGNTRTRTYTSGGPHQVLVGDILTGATSAATAKVIAITLTSGTWAGGDAAGTITFKDQVGAFQSENLNEGANSDVCTIAGDSTPVSLTAADTFDLTALPSDILQNLITVGDKAVLCVAVEQTTGGGSVTVTPILFDNESPPGVVGILPSKTFVQPYAFRRGASSGNYVLPVQIWDVAGAYKIGLHLSGIPGTSNAAQMKAWVL